jgi:serine/threonine-protein kinase RsbW
LINLFGIGYNEYIGGYTMDCRIERRISSNMEVVKNAVDEILINIQEELNENMFFNTKLILNEQIINAVKHGNNEDKDKHLEVSVLIDSLRMIIEVSDEGNGVVYNRKKFGEFDFSESGRGLMLVECLADKFAVKGSTVTCVQYLK